MTTKHGKVATVVTGINFHSSMIKEWNPGEITSRTKSWGQKDFGIRCVIDLLIYFVFHNKLIFQNYNNSDEKKRRDEPNELIPRVVSDEITQHGFSINYMLSLRVKFHFRNLGEN